METQYQKIIATCLFVLTMLALTASLYVTKDILIPFTLSIFVYFILSPPVEFIQRKLKTNKAIASGIIFVGLMVLSVLLTLFISGSISSFVQSADVYKVKISNFILSMVDQLNHFGLEVSKENITNKLQSLPFVDLLKKVTASMLGLIGNLSLITIFTFFLLIGDHKEEEKNKTFKKIKNSISKYISIKLGLSFMTGIITYIVLVSFNVELAGLIALLTFLLNFIPNIGSIVAMALPLPIVFLQYEISWQLFLIMALLITMQTIIGNIIEPKSLGDSIGLHPVIVLLALTFWGLIWGIPGMFLSIPITSTMKIVFANFRFTKRIALICEGKFS